jgi:hypothetical protein
LTHESQFKEVQNSEKKTKGGKEGGKTKDPKTDSTQFCAI